ncbi:MAG: methyl-accepting chemotaxis protein [Solirubrobacterales bacterium]
MKKLLNLSIVPAYVSATMFACIPIALISLGVFFYVGSVGGNVEQVERQVQSAQLADGKVRAGSVTARPDFNNIILEWIAFQLIASLGVGIFLRIALGNPTLRVTERLVADARLVASGDLRPTPEQSFGNEYGQLQASFGRMVGSFRQTISRIEHAAVELKRAAAEMAHTSDEAGHSIGEVAQAISAISQGASHQVDLVTQSSNVVAGIEGKIRDASEHARDAQRQSADTERLSDEGVARAAEVQDAMRAVRESSLNTAAVVRSLGDKSSDIDHIVQAITEIAHQTNMLALNASIEAARAGDQGRGFANVAEEVRVLAEDAQSSAEQIAALVREIKQQTEQAVSAMETGVMKVEDGFETVNRNRQTFYDISGAVHALHESSSEISELADGIAMGTGQVRQQIEAVATVAEESSTSTEQVSASTQETSAAAEEVSASAQKVAETAANLAELSGRFKLPAASAVQRAA